MAYRDNTKWRATVLSKKLCPWGEEKRFLFQNHSVSMCERNDGNYIGFEEACYVAGILNTPIVESFIYASSDNRSFKIRPPIYVPLYNPNDDLHKTISKLSAEALNKDQDIIDKLMEEIEDLYLNIASNRL